MVKWASALRSEAVAIEWRALFTPEFFATLLITAARGGVGALTFSWCQPDSLDDSEEAFDDVVEEERGVVRMEVFGAEFAADGVWFRGSRDEDGAVSSRSHHLMQARPESVCDVGCLQRKCGMKLLPGFALFALAVSALAGPQINHEGRILGPVPVVSQPILFNTPEADAVVSAMQIMPVTSAFNEDVSRLPLLANSDAMIAQMAADLALNRRTLQPFYEMNYVLVPDAQPVQAIHFFNYADESDLNGGVSPNGLYPIPANLPVETWPRGTGALTLSQWQQDVNNTGGDRHAIMVQPGVGLLWETWLARRVNGAWEASNGAKFDLKTNALRPAGWTSGDAAGLPMFPALVRYDECQRGMVEHAVRLVVKRSRHEYIYPAVHFAGSGADPNVPAMGQRLRLKAAFTIPATWTTAEKAVCLALKKYGGLVADNGGYFSFSVCPDDRFAANAFDQLSTIAISNFEVVQSTGATGGPRSPGAPTASAGTNFFVVPGASVARRARSCRRAGRAPFCGKRSRVRARSPSEIAHSRPRRPLSPNPAPISCG